MAAPYPSFPASPTIGQTYTDANGAVWTFGNIGWTKTLVSLTSDPSIWQDIDSALSYDSSGNVTITGGLTAGGKVSIPLGTAPLPSLYFGTDTNTGIYSPGADQVGIATNGTSRLVVDASGNVNIDSGTFYVDAVNNRVGIGTTGPSYAFDVANSVIQVGNSTDAFVQYKSTAGNWHVGVTGGGAYNFYTGTYGTGAFRMSLDASGNLGLGVVPSAWGGFKSLDLFGSTGGAIASTNGSISQSSNTYYNGTNWIYKGTGFATRYEQLGGAAGTSSHAWYTAPSWNGTGSNVITFTQAMTLDASGNLLLGTTNTATGARIYCLTASNAPSIYAECTNTSQTTGVLIAVAARNTTNGSYKAIEYYNSGAGATRFFVSDNGDARNTNGVFGAISDVKLKENIVDANSQWSDIKSIRVRNYNLKSDQTHRQIGVVAQEIEQVSPGLVVNIPDYDREGNDLGTVTKSVNYSVLYMKAVKALQEAMERIEKLEAGVAALKA